MIGTIVAVTTTLGEMVDISVQGTDSVIYKYSICVNFTPYTYEWNISDRVNIIPNFNNDMWTMNDTTTAAIAICIRKAVL